MEHEGGERKAEHQGRGHEGEREQVAGRRAYGLHPYFGKINNLFGSVGEYLKIESLT